MGAPPQTVCAAWATNADLTGCHTTSADAATITRALAAASDLLWRWSGYRWGGICEETVRPCAQNTYLGEDYADWGGLTSWGGPYWLPAWGYCACQADVHRSCACSLISEVDLGRIPLVSITQVKIDGAVLAAANYRIDDRRWLVRIDGSSWPCCQDLVAADTATNTWSASFTWGAAPPASGVVAAIDLGYELLQACTGGACSLPERVSSVARQGVNMQFISPEQLGNDGLGGIRAGVKSVDLFLSAVVTRPPALVVSPDVDGLVRRVNT